MKLSSEFKTIVRIMIRGAAALYIAVALWIAYKWTLVSFPESRSWAVLCACAGLGVLASLSIALGAVRSSATRPWVLLGKITAGMMCLAAALAFFVLGIFFWKKTSLKLNYDRPVLTRSVEKIVGCGHTEKEEYKIGIVVRRDTKVLSFGHVAVGWMRRDRDGSRWDRLIGLYSDTDRDPVLFAAIKLVGNFSKAEIRDEQQMGPIIVDGRVPMFFFRVNKEVYEKALSRSDEAHAKCDAGEGYVLGEKDCVYFVDSILSELNGQRGFTPVARQKFELPAEYVNELIRANGELMHNK